MNGIGNGSWLSWAERAGSRLRDRVALVALGSVSDAAAATGGSASPRGFQGHTMSLVDVASGSCPLYCGA